MLKPLKASRKKLSPVKCHDKVVRLIAQCCVETRCGFSASPLLRRDGFRNLLRPWPQHVEVTGRQIGEQLAGLAVLDDMPTVKAGDQYRVHPG